MIILTLCYIKILNLTIQDLHDRTITRLLIATVALVTNLINIVLNMEEQYILSDNAMLIG